MYAGSINRCANVWGGCCYMPGALRRLQQCINRCVPDVVGMHQCVLALAIIILALFNSCQCQHWLCVHALRNQEEKLRAINQLTM